MVEDKAKRKGLAKAAGGQAVVRHAPAIIVCCGSIEDFSRKMQRQSLKNLMEVGAFDLTEELLDKIVLENDLFAPYRLGDQVIAFNFRVQHYRWMSRLKFP